MPSFRDILKDWAENHTLDIDIEPILASIGDIEITSLTSPQLQACFNGLYDKHKIRGALLTRYKKLVYDVCQDAIEKGYIDSIPTVENRKAPHPNLYNAPNEKSMEILLSEELNSPAGMIIRLAWKCGLLRFEIADLLWEQVDFKEALIRLTDRNIPIPEDVLDYLKNIYRSNSNLSEYVLISEQGLAPIAKQSLSRIVRIALNQYGQRNVRLSDLRNDFIVRALQKYNWEYVSYISGVNFPSIRQHYLLHVESQRIQGQKNADVDTTVIKEVITLEGSSAEGLAMRFAWQLGVSVTKLPTLTWNQIDFDTSRLVIEDGGVSIPEDFLSILKNVKRRNEFLSDHILLTENTNRPFDYPYLYKCVQKTLIRNGLHDITLIDLQKNYWWQTHEANNHKADNLIAYLAEHRFGDYNSIMSALNLSSEDTSKLLKSCKDAGIIMQVGSRYFSPGTVVPPDKHREVILNYVAKNQPVTSNELTELLGLADRRQIFPIIKPLLSSGELVRKSINKYVLPE